MLVKVLFRHFLQVATPHQARVQAQYVQLRWRAPLACPKGTHSLLHQPPPILQHPHVPLNSHGLPGRVVVYVLNEGLCSGRVRLVVDDDVRALFSQFCGNARTDVA